MKKPLKIPRFKSEDKEREFWSNTDLADYAEPSDFARVVFPRLKPSSRPISLRLPEFLLARLQEQAHELHIPYQSLMKQYIAHGALRPKPAQQI